MGARKTQQWEASNLQPQGHHALEVLDDLGSAELALAIEAIHKGNRALLNLVAHGLSANHHLHLEAVTLALGAGDHLLQHRLLVQTEATRQIADTGHQHDVGDEVGRARGELAEKVPAVDTTLDISAIGIPRAGDNVRVRRLLDSDHLGDELGVVAEIGVHDDNEVTSSKLQAVDIRGAQTELALAGLEDNVFGAIEALELLADLEGTVRGAIVNNNDFPIEVAIIKLGRQYSHLSPGANAGSHFSLKVFCISQVIIGRLRRSL